MKPGPKPMPTVERLRRGNPGGRPMNKREPKPRKGRLVCPRWLDEEARREWKRLEPLLRDAGITTSVDRAVLAAYCRAWSRWVWACKATDKNGAVIVSKKTGQAYQGPYVNVEAMYEKQLRACEAELGMTPSSRTRVQVTQTPQEAPEVDATLKYFEAS